MHDASRLHPHHVETPGPGDARRRAIALVVLCMCALTTAIDITITNVALPFIGRDLDASVADLQWVIDAYNLALAGLLVLGGGLADRFGRRKVFLAGYALFGLGCLLAAISPSTSALIAARVVMGIGAAGVIAPALAIVAVLYPPEERARAISLWAVFGAAGLAVGPVLGGLLLDRFWWGSIFLVNVPIVAVGVVVGLRVIPESRKPDVGRLDVAGALLSVAGLGALLFGIIEGPERGWGSSAVVVGLAAGAVLTAAFVRHELRAANPLLDLRILARPVVAAGSATLFVSYVVFTGMLFVLPQWLQDVEGESIVSVGFLLVPFAGVFAFASMRSAQVMARVGAAATIAGGLAISAAGIAALAVTEDAAVAWTIAGTAVIGLGIAGLIAPPSTVVMNALPDAKAGDGSSLNMVSRFAGAAVGVAVVGSVLSTVYLGRVDEATTELSVSDTAKAEGSIQGALEVADDLSGSAGDALAAAARDAFNAGARVAYVVIAVLAAIAAVFAWFALRRVADA